MKKKFLTISAGDVLSEYDFKLAVDFSLPNTDETVLVAPTKRVKGKWEKMYPGIKVILQKDYKGYPLPTELTKFLGRQPIDEVDPILIDPKPGKPTLPKRKAKWLNIEKLNN